jgi:hypothetical protein
VEEYLGGVLQGVAILIAPQVVELMIAVVQLQAVYTFLTQE